METAALLEEATRLHREGALAEAASRYRQVLQSEPDQAQALYHLAVISCQQGRLSEGIELARRSVASDPRQPRAHNLVGMALVRLGRQQEALASFDAAISLAPDFADAHGNRAGALMDLGLLADAVAGFERALALAPDSVGDRLNLGTALHRLGRFHDAIASYDRALALDGSSPPAHFQRANVLARLGRFEEALASYDRALAIDRRYADALAGRGRLLIALGRTEGAIVNFEEALALAPGHPAALAPLVDALLARGEAARALAAVMHALAVNETGEAKALFCRCIGNRRFTSDAGGVRVFVLRALSEPWDRPADLAVPAVSLVRLNPAVEGLCAAVAASWPGRIVPENFSDRFAAIAQDPLLRAVLENVPVCDVELEHCLTGMRYLLLGTPVANEGAAEDDDVLRFFCALARQCFINEYVFDMNSDEVAGVGRLRTQLVAAIGSGGPVPALLLIAVAAFLPLYSLPGVEALLDRSWPPPVAALLTQQVREPLEERRLRSTIARLTGIDDTVSLAVKRQYEENPYPRWVKPAPMGAPKTVAQYFAGWSESRPGSSAAERVDILVAGCGTGQNLVETARQFIGGEVLAIDLSLASLCFAKRQALALGLNNIEFATADILELADLGRSFDIVDASGVLHHMADPWEGWRVLLSLLRAGGFMRVGLYSRLARRHVNAARDFVAQRGFGSGADDIRRSRREILALADGEPAKIVARYADFFTTSECRDALFHVQEHQVTLPEVARFIGDNRIEFLGFVADARVIQQFRARHSGSEATADLALWHAFETDHPDAFAGMYQFWVRKKM